MGDAVRVLSPSDGVPAFCSLIVHLYGAQHGAIFLFPAHLLPYASPPSWRQPQNFRCALCRMALLIQLTFSAAGISLTVLDVGH